MPPSHQRRLLRNWYLVHRNKKSYLIELDILFQILILRSVNLDLMSVIPLPFVPTHVEAISALALLEVLVMALIAQVYGYIDLHADLHIIIIL